MSETTLYVDRPDDERIAIYLGDRFIINANHDEHGWAGMEAAEETATRIASALGISIEHRHGDECADYR